MMTDIYCDCPYPELCKHEVAAAFTLRMLFEQPKFKDISDFMATTGLSGSWQRAQTASAFDFAAEKPVAPLFLLCYNENSMAGRRSVQKQE